MRDECPSRWYANGAKSGDVRKKESIEGRSQSKRADKSEKKQRQRHSPDVLNVRRVRETVREEGVEDAGCDRAPRTAGDLEGEQIRAESAQRVAEEHGHVVSGQWRYSYGAQGKENDGDSVE